MSSIAPNENEIPWRPSAVEQINARTIEELRLACPDDPAVDLLERLALTLLAERDSIRVVLQASLSQMFAMNSTIDALRARRQQQAEQKAA